MTTPSGHGQANASKEREKASSLKRAPPTTLFVRQTSLGSNWWSTAMIIVENQVLQEITLTYACRSSVGSVCLEDDGLIGREVLVYVLLMHHSGER
jgi:hypothetical protein